MLTSEDYAKRGENICPQCKCEDVSGGFVEIEEGRALQSMVCDNCDFEWEDIYTLVGYVERRRR